MYTILTTQTRLVKIHANGMDLLMITSIAQVKQVCGVLLDGMRKNRLCHMPYIQPTVGAMPVYLLGALISLF